MKLVVAALGAVIVVAVVLVIVMVIVVGVPPRSEVTKPYADYDD